jgi:ribonuclease HII
MPDFRFETEHGAPGRIVAGVDEVGRGPLAGPVTAAAVILPAALDPALAAEIDDSKVLRAPVRRRLAAGILAVAVVGIGWATVEEIDRLNIRQASFLAMRRALAALSRPPEMALVDGNAVPDDLGCPGVALIGGDALCLSIAAASIVAKVARDREMARLHAFHPAYGWEGNAGYGTPTHRAVLRRLGATPHHRRSFAPVRETLARLSQAS